MDRSSGRNVWKPFGAPLKINIEGLLGLKINSCEHFRNMLKR